jgi:hypothetical protein
MPARSVRPRHSQHWRACRGRNFSGPGLAVQRFGSAGFRANRKYATTPRLKIVNKITGSEKKEPPRLTVMGRNGYFTSVGKKVGEVST